MVTILLEKILSLLEGWAGSFASFIIDLMSKLDLIETETANLPDIKTNTDNISYNTDSMTATLNNIEIDTGVISSKVNNIDSNTTIIKNNINTISTNVGTASAFCEDTANNTLEIVDKITTIASDTTQLRTNSNSISSDVSEIKNTLGLYLYNTIVTEDAEGSIANFDTDLQDYLQNAVVTIPADAGGISGIALSHCGANLWDEQWELGNIQEGALLPSTTAFRSKNFIKCEPNKTYFFVATNYTNCFVFEYNGSQVYVNKVNNVSSTHTFTTGASTEYLLFVCRNSNTYTSGFGINYPATETTYSAYEDITTTVTFGSSITDGAEVDLLSGIVKINTSPVTYDSITPLAIRTFKGVNNIYSDIGDIDVTYRETLKHYLEKQNS